MDAFLKIGCVAFVGLVIGVLDDWAEDGLQILLTVMMLSAGLSILCSSTENGEGA